MSSEILNAMKISAMGMRAQGARIRVITENVANSDTTGDTPGSDPYRRQNISFKNQLDRELGIKLVEVDKISEDYTKPFPVKYMPDHPAADEEGYVKMPNVNSLLELTDIREAQRSYEANLGMIEQARTMMNRTIDLLRSA
ncbi:MAG: flagellar basal body rod protein FlgC [Alphaproteobacteria bacterium]|nr:flagellar basal body rod protein FlgC [Alphaproteobacteria bacterium]